MLIDRSYFTEGPRHILNADTRENRPALPLPGALNSGDSVGVNATIDAYIAECQEEFLLKMLGEKVGSRAHRYLMALDEDEKPSRNATYDTVLERLKLSFADYVFFHIIRDINTQATNTGLVRLKSANEYVPPLRRQVTVWNSMADRNRSFAKWAASSECPLAGIDVERYMKEKINVLNL